MPQPFVEIRSPSDLMALLIERELASGLSRHDVLARAGLQQRDWNDLYIDIAGQRTKTLGRLADALGVRFVCVAAENTTEN